MRDVTVNRPTLGPFMHVVCFRYLHDDAVELVGNALIIDAGRQRGHDIIEQLGSLSTNSDTDAIYKLLYDTLGPDGTRLCLVHSVKQTENGGYEVYSTECASPIYTLGVLIGAITAITGQKMSGKEVAVTGEEGIEGRIYHIEAVL